MRLLLMAGGLGLWLNVYLCRNELVEAVVAAQYELATGSATQPLLCVQAVLLAVIALFSVAPVWQLLLGAVCFRFSVRD